MDSKGTRRRYQASLSITLHANMSGAIMATSLAGFYRWKMSATIGLQVSAISGAIDEDRDPISAGSGHTPWPPLIYVMPHYIQELHALHPAFYSKPAAEGRMKSQEPKAMAKQYRTHQQQHCAVRGNRCVWLRELWWVAVAWSGFCAVNLNNWIAYELKRQVQATQLIMVSVDETMSL